MKSFISAILAFCLTQSVIQAQLNPPVPVPLPLPDKSEYSPIEYGPHHTVWASVTWEPTPFGVAVPHTHKYVQLATGLNVFRNGAWSPAAETIEPFQGGSVARGVQH